MRRMLLFLLIPCLCHSAFAATVWHGDVGFVDTSASPEDTAKAFYAHAVALMAEGNFRGAEEWLDRGLRRFRESDLGAKMRYRLAECAFHLGKYERAFALAGDLGRAKDSGELAAAAAGLHFEAAVRLSERTPKRGAVLLRLIADDPSSGARAAEALWRLAGIESDRGRHLHAAVVCERLYTSFPDHALARQARYQAATSRLRQVRAGGDDRQLARAEEELAACRRGLPDGDEKVRLDEYLRVVRMARSSADREVRKLCFGVLDVLQGEPRRGYGACRRAARRLSGEKVEMALYYAARALEAMQKHYKAFATADDLLTEYPDSAFRSRAMAVVFRAGESLHRRDSRHTIGVLDRVVELDPLGPYAAHAESLRGDLLLGHEEWAEATAAYDAILEHHPRSRFVAEARFKRGLCSLRIAERYDQMTDELENAYADLSLYVAEFPQGKFAPEATRLMNVARERHAGKLWEVMEFYERRKHPKAVRAYLGLLARDFADTSWGRRAAAELKRKGG